MIKSMRAYVPFFLFFSILAFSSSTIIFGDDDDDDGDHEKKEHPTAQKKHRTSWQSPSRKSVTDLGAPGYTALYKDECTSCHMAYHPALLPSASWTNMMTSLKDHFGVDATLETKTQSELLKFLISGSAETNSSKRAQKFLTSLKGNPGSPISYSTTPYFKQKHHEISPSVFKRKGINSPANCLGCHPRAEEGGFNEHEVKIPKG